MDFYIQKFIDNFWKIYLQLFFYLMILIQYSFKIFYEIFNFQCNHKTTVSLSERLRR